MPSLIRGPQQTAIFRFLRSQPGRKKREWFIVIDFPVYEASWNRVDTARMKGMTF